MTESHAPPEFDPADGESQWRQVYSECESGLRSFLRGRLGQEGDIDDCLQVVYVKMIEQARKPDHQVAVVARRAWLFRVAANEAAGLWRRKASTDKMMQRHGESEGLQPDASEKLILTETTLQLRQAVKALPEALQEIVHLRIERELTFQEIADQLGIPLGTALTRMRRALEQLKNEINSENES